MKGFFEARGICFQQAFDEASGEFVSRPIRHPFVDAIDQAPQLIDTPRNQVIDLPAAKPKRKAAIRPATARKVA